MKTLKTITTLALLVIGIGTAVPSFAKVPLTKPDYVAAAEKYEKLVVDQKAVVQEHTKMRQEYRANQAALPKADREKSLREMEEHCDGIIGEAKRLADSYKLMAQWYRFRAEELEK